jgi:hypothetical protein
MNYSYAWGCRNGMPRVVKASENEILKSIQKPAYPFDIFKLFFGIECIRH